MHKQLKPLLFLIILSLVPFVHINGFQDNIYYNGWILSVLLVILIPKSSLSTKTLFLTSLFFLSCYLLSGNIDINILPSVLLFSILYSCNLYDFLGLHRIINFLKINILLISLLLVYKLISNENLNHQITYSIFNFGSHRNIVLQYFACLISLLSYFDFKIKRCFTYHLVGIFFCSVLMCKTALLILIISLLVNFLKNQITLIKLSKILFLISLIAFISFNSFNYFQFKNNIDKYVSIVEKRSDFVKQFDLIFQIKNGSFKDRFEIWNKSSEQFSINGLGLGYWKIRYNSENIGTITRRPHNELIRYLTEMGVLFLLPLFFFLRNLRTYLPFIPLVLFSFPTERPEFILLFILISEISKKQTVAPVQFSKVLSVKLLFSISVILMSLTASLQYKLYTQQLYYSETTSFNQKLLNISKRDFLLNRIELFKINDAMESSKNKIKEIKKLLESNDPELSKIKQEILKNLKPPTNP